MKQNGNSRQAQCMKIVLETIVQRRGRTMCLVCDTEKDGFKNDVWHFWNIRRVL